MRTGTGARRGARLGSPTISCSLNFSMPSLSPSSGQASAARYWIQQETARPAREIRRRAVHRADVVDRDRAGLAETRQRARQVDVAFLRVHRAAEPSVRAVMVVDRPLVAARHDHHRAVLHVDIVEHDADRGEILVGVRVERPILVPFDRRAIAGRLHVELAGVEAHGCPTDPSSISTTLALRLARK